MRRVLGSGEPCAGEGRQSVCVGEPDSARVVSYLFSVRGVPVPGPGNHLGFLLLCLSFVGSCADSLGLGGDLLGFGRNLLSVSAEMRTERSVERCPQTMITPATAAATSAAATAEGVTSSRSGRSLGGLLQATSRAR